MNSPRTFASSSIIKSITRSIPGYMNAGGVMMTFAIMLLICADIIGRNIFDNPLSGVPELVSLALVASVFLQLAHALAHKRLTTADALLARLSNSQLELVSGWRFILAFTGFGILIAMAAGAFPDFTRAYASHEFAGVEGSFTITVWPVKLIIVVGALIAAISCLPDSLKQGKALMTGKGFPALLIPVLIALSGLLLWQGNPEPLVIGVAMIIMVLVLIALGMPIALALLSTGFIGLALIKQDFTIATRSLSLAAEGTISEYVFATVPLFVLMGLFVNLSDIGRDAFRSAQGLFGRVRGGLGIATVAANAIFAAITGISIASAAIFSKIAVPELVRHGYTKQFAVGLTAGSSILGMLIPPSLLLIIYGVIAEVSIGDLFIAAIIPGLLLAFMLAAGVVTMAVFMPGFVGKPLPLTDEEQDTAAQSGGVIPILILIIVVLGGIYGGFFTPTEAGAAGAFVAMIIAFARKRLNWHSLWNVMSEAGQVSVSILFLIICASTFSMMLTLTELPLVIASLLGNSELGLSGFLMLYLMLLVILGTVLDSTSIMLIILPLALPVVSALGGDLVWFGIVTVVGIEIGLLTPPLGLSVYVIKSSLDDDSISLAMIFKGAFPFALLSFAACVLLMLFPKLSLILL